MNCRKGLRTPWGQAQTVEDVAPGVTVVSTASHGGIKLDRVRNAKVPAGCRQRGGWYEEDCEVAIVFAVHKDVARHFKVDEDATALSLATWLPDCYRALRNGGLVKATPKAEAIYAKSAEEDPVHVHSSDPRFCGDKAQNRRFTTDPSKVTCGLCKNTCPVNLEPLIKFCEDNGAE